MSPRARMIKLTHWHRRARAVCPLWSGTKEWPCTICSRETRERWGKRVHTRSLSKTQESPSIHSRLRLAKPKERSWKWEQSQANIPPQISSPPLPRWTPWEWRWQVTQAVPVLLSPQTHSSQAKSGQMGSHLCTNEWSRETHLVLAPTAPVKASNKIGTSLSLSGVGRWHLVTVGPSLLRSRKNPPSN